jgi:hypothetical protein
MDVNGSGPFQGTIPTFAWETVENHINLTHDTCSDRDSNLTPPEYEYEGMCPPPEPSSSVLQRDIRFHTYTDNR